MSEIYKNYMQNIFADNHKEVIAMPCSPEGKEEIFLLIYLQKNN